VLYIDSSALVKLAVEEPESGALIRFLDDRPTALVTSIVTYVEVRRAARRVAATEAGDRALRTVALVELTSEIRARAAAVEPIAVRSLDAIQLATALTLGDEVECLVAYDKSLVEAARANGLEVVSPPYRGDQHSV
jgi:uncharacterized protein